MSNDGLAVRFRTLLLVAISMGLLIAVPIAQRKVYVHDDLGYYSIPLRSYFAQCLAAGQRPDWCPALFGGFSLYGEGGGFAHPVIRVLYGTLPLDMALNSEVIGPYPVMLVGFALLLTRWGLRRDAALFGGLVYAFGGQNILQYIHTSVSSLLGHLPWVLLCIDVALRSEDRRRVAMARIGLALLTASQLLIGHIQFLWISMLGEGIYALFLVRKTPAIWRPLGGLTLSIGLGLLAGSIQLLPSWEAFRESRREQPTLTYVATGSLAPANLIQTVSPYLTRSRVVTPPMKTDEGVDPPAGSMYDWRVHAYTMYLGASIPVLLVGLFITRRELRGSPRALGVFALSLAVVGLILSFGDFTPLFNLLVKIPVVGRFRIAARYLILFQAAAAMLAGLAFTALSRRVDQAEPIAWKRLWPLAIPFVFSLFFALAPGLPEGAWPSYLRGDLISPALMVAVGPVLVGLATILVALAGRGWRAALPILVVFTTLDQAAYAIHANLVRPQVSLATYLQLTERPAAVDDGTRIAHSQLHMTWQDPYLMQGLRTMQGYVSLAPRRRLTFDTPNSMRVAGVGWVSRGATGAQQSWDRAPLPPLPRARLITQAQVSDDPRQDLERIDPGTIALTERAITLPAAMAGQAKITGDQPGRIDVRTDAPTRQLLVVSESYHDGWNAEIDGRPARLDRAYGDFLACVVPKGKHRVKLRFSSQGRQFGAWLSLAGVILAIGVPLIPLIPTRTGRGTASILLGPKRAKRDAGLGLSHVDARGRDSHG